MIRKRCPNCDRPMQRASKSDWTCKSCNAASRTYTTRQPDFEPTADDIRRECHRIRKTWSAAQRRERWQHPVFSATIPVIQMPGVYFEHVQELEER